MVFQVLIVLALAAYLFPAVRRRLKGAAGLTAVAFLLFLLVVSFASGR
jgi:hypothetical protein